MNEELNIPPSAIPDGPDTEVFDLLKKMQQQMLFLERKIDLLIRQSQDRQPGERPFSNRPSHKRPFSKQYRPFDHSRHRSRGEHGHNPRESESAPVPFYENRPRGKSRGANPRKKTFSFKRKDKE
jgi:hypothetical protein